MNSGHARRAWMLAALFAVLLLAIVFFGWWPARVRLAMFEARRGVEAPVETEASALARVIEKLDQRLARIETALAVQDSRGTRGEVVQNSAAPAFASNESTPAGSPTIAGADELHADLLQISKRIDLLAGSIKENHKPVFLLPTLEQIHSARRDVDWTFVEQLRALAATSPDAASDRVRGMTFDDVLKKVGLPQMIDDEHGYWNYFRQQPDDQGQPRQTGVRFVFVGDSVSTVWRVN